MVLRHKGVQNRIEILGKWRLFESMKSDSPSIAPFWQNFHFLLDLKSLTNNSTGEKCSSSHISIRRFHSNNNHCWFRSTSRPPVIVGVPAVTALLQPSGSSENWLTPVKTAAYTHTFHCFATQTPTRETHIIRTHSNTQSPHNLRKKGIPVSVQVHYCTWWILLLTQPLIRLLRICY